MAGQLWATDSLGGYLYSDNLSKELRMTLLPATKFRQFADVKDAAHQGKSKGDTFHWNIYTKVATAATASLTETNTMPETNFTIRQGTLTITEEGNSVPFTGKVQDLGEHDVKEVVRKVLKQDALERFDKLSYDQFNSTPLRVVPASGTSTTSVSLTTNGTATATNNIAMGKEHVKLIVDTMKERNIPTYSNGDYYSIGWPSTYRQLKNDLETIHQYTDKGLGMIMNGEVGRYEGVRFVEQTNIAKSGWQNGKSDWSFFFGNDTVAEAIAVPEEIRAKIPSDYGRSHGIAWYYLGGFGIVRSNASDATIVKWDSAV